jgi:hypothetical protein
MVDRIPWAYVEAGRFIAGCIATGAVLGVAGVLWQMWGERRG